MTFKASSHAPKKLRNDMELSGDWLKDLDIPLFFRGSSPEKPKERYGIVT